MRAPTMAGEALAHGTALEGVDAGIEGSNGATFEGQGARLRLDSILEVEGSRELGTAVDGDERLFGRTWRTGVVDRPPART